MLSWLLEPWLLLMLTSLMMKSNGSSQQNKTLNPTNSLLKYINMINPQEICVHIFIIAHDVHLDTNPFDTTDFYKTGCIWISSSKLYTGVSSGSSALSTFLDFLRPDWSTQVCNMYSFSASSLHITCTFSWIVGDLVLSICHTTYASYCMAAFHYCLHQASNNAYESG